MIAFIAGSSASRYGGSVEETVRKTVRRLSCRVALIVAGSLMPFSVAHAEVQVKGQCTTGGSLAPLAGLSEASGLAASRRVPGRFWTHNDSGSAVLFALDSRGGVAGQVRVDGATVEDWEAVAVGPCGAESCLYLGDIGDNEANRRRITVYRVPEPGDASGTATVSGVFHATYPDGAHDAETLLMADGRLYVVTKGETGPVAIYRFPVKMEAGATVKLEQVGTISSQRSADSRITDGSVSPDGQWVVLRSRSALTFYRASDVLAGRSAPVSSVNVTALNERQGEGVAFGDGNTVALAGEGGGKGQPGTFARFSCVPPTD